MKSFDHKVGQRVHYHAETRGPFRADLLCVSVHQKMAVLVILSNEAPNWPVRPGQTFVWPAHAERNDDIFHPESECPYGKPV